VELSSVVTEVTFVLATCP